MSAGVSDQRMKGQGNTVSNGPKEQLGTAGTGGEGGASGSGAADQEFETWRSQHQQQQQNSAGAHTNPYGPSVPISTATDLYNMSTAGYYGSGGTFPYQAYGVGDGTWSNGQDPMTFLSGYHHDSYSIDGMFGPSTTFSTPNPFGQPSSFNYFHSNGDYNTWGSQIGQRKYDEYYRDQQNMYTQAMPDTLKCVEQAMQNLDLKSESKDQKKTTWASIASQPAKPQLPVQSLGLKKKGPGMPPGPIIPGKHNMDIGTWDTNKSTPQQPPPTFVNNAPPVVPKSIGTAPAPSMPVRPAWNGPPTNRGPSAPRPGPPHTMQSYQPPMLPPHMQPPTVQNMMPPSMPPTMPPMVHHQQSAVGVPLPSAVNPLHPVLDELRVKNNYNPGEFDLDAPNARFFVIKSYSEDDIHRSIKYEIWCSTEHGNKRLDQAFREREREPNGGAVFLFFSVNGSGHFCGMAQMMSPLDYNSNSSVWSQDKWKGQFKVRWVYVKDVPNVQLRYIRLENNENKPVTNSRDTQEVPHAKGLQVLRIIHTYRHSTSIFDDFIHYEKRQEEEDTRKQPEPHPSGNGVMKNHGGHDMRDHHGPQNHHRDHRDRDQQRDRGDRDRDRGHHRNHHQDQERHNSDHRPPHHGRNHDNDRGMDRGDRSDRGDRDKHHDRGHHKERGDRGGRGGRNRN